MVILNNQTCFLYKSLNYFNTNDIFYSYNNTYFQIKLVKGIVLKLNTIYWK